MVKVNDKYGIQVDEYNYAVMQFKTAGEKSKNKGEEYSECIAYCSTFTGAIKDINKRMVRDKLSASDMSLDEAVRAVEDANIDMLRCLGNLEMIDRVELKRTGADGTKI